MAKITKQVAKEATYEVERLTVLLEKTHLPGWLRIGISGVGER